MKKGGEFIAQGEDTCVYNPPLACAGQPAAPRGKYVSRVVNSEAGESRIQTMIRDAVKKAEALHPGKVAPYFNLMEGSCRSFTVGPTDVWNKKTSKRCSHDPRLRMTGEVGEDAGLENIITPIQGETVVVVENNNAHLSRSPEETAAALKNLLIALAYVDGAFIHNDAHGRNMSWMPDGRIVLFDWGRSFMYNPSVMETMINDIVNKTKEYESYTQFWYLTYILENTSQTPEALSNVWDILAIIGLINTYDVVPASRIAEVMDVMNDRLRAGRISQSDLLALIEWLFSTESEEPRTPMAIDSYTPERSSSGEFDVKMRDGGRRKKGGEFMAQGVDTCVYNPPLSCKGIPDPPPGTVVSRVVRATSGESRIQAQIREIVQAAEDKYRRPVMKYFNFMEYSCGAFTVKPTDISNTRTGDSCKHYEELRRPGNVEEAADLENIITPIQDRTIVVKVGKTVQLSKSPAETAEALKDLMIALIYVDGAFIHNDAHGKNMAWMPDGHVVLFDWGRAFVFDADVVRRKIDRMVRKEMEYYNYPQYKYLVAVLKYVNPKAYAVSNVWDILGIIGVMSTYNIIPNDNVVRAVAHIRDMLPNGKIKQGDLLRVVQEMFEPGPAVIPPMVRPKPRYVETESSVESESPPPVRYMMRRGGVRQTAKFCRCIKAVRKTIKARPGSTKESGAIAVCNTSILGRKGRTLKKFRCGKKPYLKTQKKLK